MKALVVYDSLYGNTEKIAQAIGSALDCKAKLVSKVAQSELTDLELLVVGSPTHGGQTTKELQKFLKNIPANSLKNIKVATFDTRFAEKEHSFGLRAIIKLVGFAAPRIARDLQAKGGNLIVKPEGFIVGNKKGPLKDGEMQRAKTWINEILLN